MSATSARRCTTGCWPSKAGGRFLLRIDDTDAERSREEYVEAIREDLAWLGLEPDGEERQSERLDHYEAAFEALQRSGPGLSLLRDRAGTGTQAQGPARARAAADLRPRRAAAERGRACSKGGRRTAAALALQARSRRADRHGTTACAGAQHFDPAQLSDPVVRRADGSWLYMLPSAVDDIAMGVTDVLRGEDHVSNTAVQIQMFTALGAAPPRFAHEALLVGQRGQAVEAARLARLRCLPRAGDRAGGDGRAARAARHLAAGRADRASARCWSRVSISPPSAARRRGSTMPNWSGSMLRSSTSSTSTMLQQRLPEGMDRAGWEAIRPNLSHVGEAADWWQVVTGPIEAPDLSDEDRAYLSPMLQPCCSGATTPGTR